MLVGNNRFNITSDYTYIQTDGRISGIKVGPPGEDFPHHVVCEAVGRDADTFYRIMEDATIINHITGKPMIRKSVLYRKILLKFFKGWNLVDSKDVPIPLNVQKINELHPALQKDLANKWLKATG